MKNNATCSSRRRLLGLIVILGLAAAFTASACGADSAGFACSSEEDCAEDLSCEFNEQGAVCSDGFCGCDYGQSTCTQFCSSDDDCPYDLVCNRTSTCGGAPDLCGRP